MFLSGPSHWEGECQTGRSQSPVDLPRTNLTLIKEAKFVFDNYDSTPDEGKLENNGHTVKYSAKPVDKERAPKVSLSLLSPGSHEPGGRNPDRAVLPSRGFSL